MKYILKIEKFRLIKGKMNDDVTMQIHSYIDLVEVKLGQASYRYDIKPGKFMIFKIKFNFEM